jgi:hypothetical protein
MTTATRHRPIQPDDVKRNLNTRVRMVVMADEQLNVDQVLVGDLVGLARRVDGKRAYEAILFDVLGRMYAVSLRRIRSIDPWAAGLPALYRLVRNPALGQPAAARLTKQGGHLDRLCHRCSAVLPDGRPHINDLACRRAANDAAVQP